MHPGNLAIKDFTYELPDNRIAYYPAEKRDESKLLIFENGGIRDTVFKEISTYISAESLLVFNNTRVVPARLHAVLTNGKIIEIFCLGPANEQTDMQTAFASTKSVRWKCLLGGAKKWKSGKLIKRLSGEEEAEMTIEKIAAQDHYWIIEFVWGTEKSFAEILESCGETPLPPYIKRAINPSDLARYQTVYNLLKGSVAAPTAGLHFTENVFQSFKEKNIHTGFLTLHVGAGTFMPVKSETMQGHDMHTEVFEVAISLLDQLMEAPGKIIAVGTTSLRVLESLYWMGKKIYHHPEIELSQLQTGQWEAYESDNDKIFMRQSLPALKKWMQQKKMQTLYSRTKILIAPGYTFRIADGLITNFHQPGSTLLLLVAAFVGDKWREIYQYALKNNFRFLSYGDSSLLFRKKENM